MKTYTFTLKLTGNPDVNALYEAGCDDALHWQRGDEHFLDFDREAPDLKHAIASAIVDAQKVEGVTAEVFTP